MATIVTTDGQELSREQEIALLVALGMPEAYARFVVAVGRGEIRGDVVELDEEGNEIKHVDHDPGS